MIKNIQVETSGKQKEFNYGFALLRALMCFEVVLNHYWPEKVIPPHLYGAVFSMLTAFAVPVFMFLSFYLMERLFVENDIKYFRKRLRKLAYPLIGWSVIYYFVYLFIQIKIDCNVKFTDLLWSIFSGASEKLNGPLWFQSQIIYITILFFLIFKFFKTDIAIFITWILLILSWVFEYSGLNFKIFDSQIYEIKWSFGRFVEMVPYATMGLSCAYFNVFEKLKQKRIYSCILFGFLCCFFFKYWMIKPASGFGYEFNQFMILVFFVIGFVYLIPFEKLPEKLKTVLRFLTKYTLGIYCMHLGLGKILNIYFEKMSQKINNFILCIIIYILGFIISFLLDRIPSKWAKQLVE